MIDLIRKRRSIRKYTSESIDKKPINLLVETLLRSPTSRNIKSCEFVIIDNQELLQKLANSKESGSQFLEHAALGIVVCGNSTKTDVWIEDGSIASILVQMTVQSLRLGSCWIQIRNRMHASGNTAEKYVQGLLGLPEHMKVLSIISIGHPDEKRKPVAKSELDYGRIKHNNYANKYYKSSQN